MHPGEELLLLTPLVKPLPASSLTKKLLAAKDSQNQAEGQHEMWAHNGRDRSAILSGEGVFREFGKSLARAQHLVSSLSRLMPIETFIKLASPSMLI
ncbi:hypothetical protein LB505_006288 [Fusarium chuoi]|nr:hypothetical protein LB505_006288 [Fusarium chuoi]